MATDTQQPQRQITDLNGRLLLEVFALARQLADQTGRSWRDHVGHDLLDTYGDFFVKLDTLAATDDETPEVGF